MRELASATVIDPNKVGFEATIVGTELRQEGGKKPYTVYLIQVVQLDQTYQIVRRYSEFDALHKRVRTRLCLLVTLFDCARLTVSTQSNKSTAGPYVRVRVCVCASVRVQLKKKFPQYKFVSLPKKHLVGNLGSDIVSSRRLMLENFLEDLLMKPDVRSSSDLIIFLQPSDNYSKVIDLKRNTSDAQALEAIKAAAGAVAVSSISAASGVGNGRQEPDGADARPLTAEGDDDVWDSRPISLGENLSLMLGPASKKQYTTDDRQRARAARRLEQEQEAERKRLQLQQIIDRERNSSISNDIEQIRRDIAQAQAEIEAEILASKASLQPAAYTTATTTKPKPTARTPARYNIEVLRVSHLPPIDGALSTQLA